MTIDTANSEQPPPHPSMWQVVRTAFDPRRNLSQLFHRAKKPVKRHHHQQQQPKEKSRSDSRHNDDDDDEDDDDKKKMTSSSSSSETAHQSFLTLNLDFLDGVRALSHLWIVVHHVHYLMGIMVDRDQLGITSNSWIMRFFGMQGPFSVNIMLVLSGFLGFRSILALPEARNGRLEALSIRTILRFYWNRFLRLAPLYYVMVFIYWWNMDLEVFMNPLGLLYSALFVSNYVPVENALYLISWSVCVDMHLYLALPLLYEGYRRLVRRYRVVQQQQQQSSSGDTPSQVEEKEEDKTAVNGGDVEEEECEKGAPVQIQSKRDADTATRGKQRSQPVSNSDGMIMLTQRGWYILIATLVTAILLSVIMRVHFIYPHYINEISQSNQSSPETSPELSSSPLNIGNEMSFNVKPDPDMTHVLGMSPSNFTLPYRAYLYNMVKEVEVIQLINELSFFSSEYRYTHLRYTPFICGVFLAIVFNHRAPSSTNGRPRGLLLLLALMGMVGILVPNASGGEPGSWTAFSTFVYLSFHHIVFSLCFTYALYTDLYLLSMDAAGASNATGKNAVAAGVSGYMQRAWHGVFVRFRKMLEWQGWCIIARLSYANYITHFATIIVEYRMMPRLTEMNDMLYITLALVNVPLTLVIALVFHLLIEKPISNLASHFFKSDRSRQTNPR